MNQTFWSGPVVIEFGSKWRRKRKIRRDNRQNFSAFKAIEFRDRCRDCALRRCHDFVRNTHMKSNSPRARTSMPGAEVK